MDEGGERLIFTATNECNVTKWPYETAEVRKVVIGEVSEALSEGDPVVLLLWDLDNLKGLNDACGSHGEANKGIRLAAETAKERLEKIEGVKKILFWRPQSGGDEFNVLVIMEKGQEVPIEEMMEAVISPISFKYEKEKNPWQITSTAAVAVRKKLDEGTGAAEIYQGMVEEAEEKQNLRKIKKAIDYFEETRTLIARMGPETSKEVMNILVDRFGPRRVGRKIMRMIVNLVQARIIKATVGSESPRKRYVD